MEGRLRGVSEGVGDGDRGRLKRKGLVGLEEVGGGLEGLSGGEAMVRRVEWSGVFRWFMNYFPCHPCRCCKIYAVANVKVI